VHHFLTDALILSGVAVLLFAAAHDVGFRTVPDCASIALLLIGLAWRLLDNPRLLPWSGGIAAVILIITYMLWRQGWMGGGDVKLLTAAGMFVPPWLVPLMVSGTALAGGGLALFYLLAGLVVKRPGRPRPAHFVARVLRCEQWRLSRRGPLPYAAAIAAGGLIATLHT
jgi:prepilin peptidase CpaA